MANILQIKRGAQASLPTLNQAELGFSTDEKRVYIGDGAANIELARYNNLPALPSDENLVGYWAFDDGSGTIAVDGSGNGNNGTLVNMEEADWVDGVVGKCLDFDGVDEHVIISDDPSLDIANNLTVSAWVYLNSHVSGWYSGMAKGGCWEFRIRGTNDTTPGRVQFVAFHDDATYTESTSSEYLNTGTWYHLTLVYEKDVALTVYINGEVKGTSTSNITKTIVTNNNSVYIGFSSVNFPGKIDEPRIYNSALTASEIKALYLYPAGNKGTKISGLQIGGSPVPTTYTAAKCTDADADQTSVNVALNSARTEGYVTTIQRPGGAAFSSSASSSVGVIKITLPQSWSNTMMKFFVDVFEYTTGKSFTLDLAGYNFIPGSFWTKCTANLSGSTAANNRVRFGHDGTKCCICIGETNSDWSWLKTSVRDFQAGTSNYSISQWDDGWSISVLNDLSGITFTADIADSLIDASDSDTLDGQHGSYYANSGANSDITSMTGLNNDGIPLAKVANAASDGANSDITSLSGLTTDLSIAQGGTGQSTAQLAINSLSAVSGATNEHVLTKDTSTGNAIFKEVLSGAYQADYVKVSDVKAYNAHGGTFTSGADQTRVINTEDSDSSAICTISSNQITLAAGTYECNISTPTMQCNSSWAWLYNITDSSVELLGSTERSDSSSGTTSRNEIKGRFTIAAQKTFEIRHRCTTTQAGYGFGYGHGVSGTNNVYTIAEFWRVAT